MDWFLFSSSAFTKSLFVTQDGPKVSLKPSKKKKFFKTLVLCVRANKTATRGGRLDSFGRSSIEALL